MQEESLSEDRGSKEEAQSAALEIRRVFDVQQTAYMERPASVWKERCSRLQRLENLILENKTEIEKAVNADFGCRAFFQTDLLDIYPTLSEIRLMKKRGEGWTKRMNVAPDVTFFPARCAVIPEPKGVVGIMAPWNYPLYLSVAPAAAAFAAGNRCMIKVSEKVPAFSRLLKKLVSRYFLEDELAVIEGGIEESVFFASLPFNHLLFTGSSAVGRKIMQAASANLTPVTLELGGKSPVIIAPDAHLPQAAERILVGKLLNAGQTCIAPDYVLVQKRSLPRLLGLLKDQAKKLYPKGLLDPNYTSVIDQGEMNRLISALQEASGTSRIESLFDGDQVDPALRKIAPQLVIDPSPVCELMTEEIFGPILPIITYPDEHFDEALEMVAKRPEPLAVYLFDQDKKRIRFVLETLKAGGVTVNDTLWHATQSGLPFGGVGNSGMGCWKGETGVKTFSHLKPVFLQSPFSFADRLNPPYSKFVQQWVQKKLQPEDGRGCRDAAEYLKARMKDLAAKIRRD
jgi:coniferyl-aldehyde dehydrogenase